MNPEPTIEDYKLLDQLEEEYFSSLVSKAIIESTPLADKNIMLTIVNMNKGDERIAAIRAFAKYPTLKTDCRLARARKENLRQEYIKRLLNEG